MWVSRVLVLLAIALGSVAACLGIVLLVRRFVPAIREVTPSGETNFDKAFTFVSLAWSLLFFTLVLAALADFSNYQLSAHEEATDLASAWGDAETFPPPLGESLQREIGCYARLAESEEWLGQPDVPSVEANQTLERIRIEVAAVPPDEWNNLAMSGSFINELESLEDHRGNRLSYADGLLTPPLWLVYVLLTLLLLGVSVFVPSRAGTATRHVVFVSCVALAIAAVTIGLAYLDRPGDAGLEWTEMQIFVSRVSDSSAWAAGCPVGA